MDTNLRQKKMDCKRRQILKSAFKIFARKGYHETTIEEIAQHAKVGKGTVFIYFPTKLELLVEAFRVHSIFKEVSDTNKLIEGKDDREILKDLALKDFEHYRKNWKLRRLWMMEAIKLAPKNSKLFYRALALPLTQALQKYIANRQEEKKFRKGDSFILARTFWGILFALHFWNDMMGGRFMTPHSTEEIISEVVDLYLYGVKNPIPPEPFR
jgi:AcrR family transcriptional regulator